MESVDRAGFDALVRDVGAVVFDWNGTVVDDAERSLAATNEVLEELGHARLDDALFRARFRLPMGAFFAAVGVGAADLAVAERRWNERLGRGNLRLHPGVVDLLQVAHCLGIPAGVVSAAGEAAVRDDARELGIEHLFAFIVGAAADKAAALAEIVAGSDGPVVYVGDTEYDIASALAAGAVAVGFGGGYRPARALVEAGALAVIDDFSSMANALLGGRTAVVQAPAAR